MDKLRAMEYLVRVVEAGSFARAARDLNVSPPAVSKMIAVLERELGTRLLHRDSRRVSLTSDGEQFVPDCMNALAYLRAAEMRLSANRTRAHGRLIVGIAHAIGRHCVAPFLPEFMMRHPELALDLRAVSSPNEASAGLVDVLLYMGWLDKPDIDMVAKCIGQSRFLTCASPSYWLARGRPQDPEELRNHDCVAFRLPRGEILDLWKYQRDGVARNVALNPRVVSDNRDWLIEAAIRGIGVMRATDLNARSFIEQGLLEPIFSDWEALEAPPIYVLYRRGSRSSARVRAFVDFATELFANLQAPRSAAEQAKFGPVPMPVWFRRNRAGPLAPRERQRRTGTQPSS